MNFKFQVGQWVKISNRQYTGDSIRPVYQLPGDQLFRVNEKFYSAWSGQNTYHLSAYGSDTNIKRYEEDLIPLVEPNKLFKDLL